MNEYINQEVRELARLQSIISSQTTAIIATTIMLVILLVTVTISYSVSVSKKITEPISALADKVQHLGNGKLITSPINTTISELQTLDHGIDDMASQINSLIDKQIDDQRALHKA